jgi:hypothetical protein
MQQPQTSSTPLPDHQAELAAAQVVLDDAQLAQVSGGLGPNGGWACLLGPNGGW